MAKKKEKERALELRRQGMSVNAIAKAVDVSLSTASRWCKEVPLTDEQEYALQHSDARRKAQTTGAKANETQSRERRIGYQEAGREKAREGDLLHLAGCMLYWGEGTKDRYTVTFVNSDTDMIAFHMRFLREALNVPEEKMKVRINAYLGNGLSEEDIIDYWLDLLNLPEENLNKCSFNKQPSSSKQKGRKLLYGVCEISVSSVEYSQHIYGAIQEYAGIDRPEWLD